MFSKRTQQKQELGPSAEKWGQDALQVEQFGTTATDRDSATGKSLLEQGLSEAPARKIFGFMWVAPHVNEFRLVAFLIAIFASMAMIVFFAAAQSWVLNVVLKMSGNTGDATGSLSTYSEIMSVVAVVVWGTLSDRMSKRAVLSISLVIMGVIAIAYPHAKNLYPTLLILRLVYSIGTAGTTCMMAAMMVEVMHKKNGILVGLIGASTGLGAIFAAFCLFSVPSRFAYLQKDLYDPISIIVGYATVGACCAFVGFLLWPAMPRSKSVLPEDRRSFKDFFIRVYRGVKAGKDPRIALGFVTSFFARADEVVISNFIALWVQEYYIEKGVCRVGAICYPASATTETMTGIAQSVALASAPLFALMSEYLPKELGVVLAGIVGAIGCFPFARSVDPTSNTSLALVILIAIGQYGMIISGMAMIGGDYIDPDIQGSVAGAYSFCGAIGIIVVSKIGGVLFDKFMKGAPFLLLGIGHVICSLFAVIIVGVRLFFYVRDKRNQ